MRFTFSRHGLSPREHAVERALEMIPGALSWSILLGMTALAIRNPLAAAALVIAFNLYWVFRLFYITIFLVVSYAWLAIEQSTDWMARVRDIDRLAADDAELSAQRPRSLASRASAWAHRRDVARLARSGSLPPSSESLYHLIIIPVSKELPAILALGVERLAQQAFPTRRMLLIFALEAWAPVPVAEGVERLAQQYRERFFDVVVAVHPEGLPGEARVKGANVTFAARRAAEIFRSRRIGFDRVIVSCFDADTVVSPEYFGCLTCRYLLCPDRTRASFQPIPVFHNNIWEAPGFTRVLDIGSSFFQMVEATHPDRLVTFSSHSMSFEALVDVGYWPVDLISDDSAIYWKAFIHYDGRYRVVPLPVTVSMDAVNAGSWWKTVVNVYKQKRRWAWGVENFPIVMRAFLRGGAIPLRMRARRAFKLLEGHVAWATWAFLLTVIGWLPALFASREFSDSVLYYSAPRIAALIFHLSALALAVTIVLSLCLLPRARVRFPWVQRAAHAIEWLCVPVVATLLSALPALEAQTRLMAGRYMEFWVTEKFRSSPGPHHVVAEQESAYDDPTTRLVPPKAERFASTGGRSKPANLDRHRGFMS